MCFTPIKRTPLIAPLSDSTSNPTNKDSKGSTYTVSDIKEYREQTKNTMKSYTSLSLEQKTTAATPEFVGIKGAVTIPAATSYTDAQSSLTEVVSLRGDISSAAQSQNIELCGFLNDLPALDWDMSAPQGGIPSLQDLMKAVNGISMPVMDFGADAIVSAIGGATKAVTDLASAIQTSVPTVSCGKLPIPTPTTGQLATALIPGAPLLTVAAPVADQVGITPPINITSPDVTVEALNDVLEAGEF